MANLRAFNTLPPGLRPLILDYLPLNHLTALAKETAGSKSDIEVHALRTNIIANAKALETKRWERAIDDFIALAPEMDPEIKFLLKPTSSTPATYDELVRPLSQRVYDPLWLHLTAGQPLPELSSQNFKRLIQSCSYLEETYTSGIYALAFRTDRVDIADALLDASLTIFPMRFFNGHTTSYSGMVFAAIREDLKPHFDRLRLWQVNDSPEDTASFFSTFLPQWSPLNLFGQALLFFANHGGRKEGLFDILNLAGHAENMRRVITTFRGQLDYLRRLKRSPHAANHKALGAASYYQNIEHLPITHPQLYLEDSILNKMEQLANEVVAAHGKGFNVSDLINEADLSQPNKFWDGLSYSGIVRAAMLHELYPQFLRFAQRYAHCSIGLAVRSPLSFFGQALLFYITSHGDRRVREAGIVDILRLTKTPTNIRAAVNIFEKELTYLKKLKKSPYAGNHTHIKAPRYPLSEFGTTHHFAYIPRDHWQFNLPLDVLEQMGELAKKVIKPIHDEIYYAPDRIFSDTEKKAEADRVITDIQKIHDIISLNAYWEVCMIKPYLDQYKIAGIKKGEARDYTKTKITLIQVFQSRVVDILKEAKRKEGSATHQELLEMALQSPIFGSPDKTQKTQHERRGVSDNFRRDIENQLFDIYKNKHDKNEVKSFSEELKAFFTTLKCLSPDAPAIVRQTLCQMIMLEIRKSFLVCGSTLVPESKNEMGPAAELEPGAPATPLIPTPSAPASEPVVNSPIAIAMATPISSGGSSPRLFALPNPLASSSASPMPIPSAPSGP